MEALTSRDYQTAIDVQDACNLSGVVNHFSLLLKKISAEARKKGLGTDYVNRHPICRMFAEKVAQLTNCGDPPNWGSFRDAYNTCKAKAI